MNTLRPHIDEILNDFFARQLDGTTGLRRKRIERVDSSLRDFLEREGHQVLANDNLVLLRAEREFRPDVAFVHTMHADDLIVALDLFIADPWLAEHPSDRRVQLRLTDLLAGHVLGTRLIDRSEMMCALLHLRHAIDQAKRTLKPAVGQSRTTQQAVSSQSPR